MPHFHIPLQSGSDEILSTMRRRYRSDLYRSRVDYIRKKMPHAGIGVDVIVGFPGESDSRFKDTYDFVNSLNVSYLHVFTYSERPNTTALRIDDVIPVQTRQNRNKMLRILSLKKQREHYEKFIGSISQVLIESSEDEDLVFGYTPEYVRVAVNLNTVSRNTTNLTTPQHDQSQRICPWKRKLTSNVPKFILRIRGPAWTRPPLPEISQ